MIAIVGFNYSALLKLEKLYQGTLKNAVDMELAKDAEHIGENIYMIIANAVINRDVVKTDLAWAAGKRESLTKLQKVAAAADTQEERARIREAQEAFDDIIRIFEEEMLPLIRTGAGVPGQLADMDARVDKKIEAINKALEWVARSESDENQSASGEFHAALAKIISFGLTISLIGVIIMLSVSTLTTRRVIRPVAELTRAAQEMEKGNYLIEVNHRSDDETGMLANAFRGMAEQVGRRSGELESKVKERTVELFRVDKELRQENSMRRRTDQELRKSHEQLRHLAAHLQSVREEERTNIAREIHDELGQILTALRMDLAVTAESLSANDGDEAATEQLREALDTVKMMVQTVRRICTELRPSQLDHLGLGAAIEWQAGEFQKRTGITCEVILSPVNISGDLNLATALFRIFQEALTNILRHAKATKVKVILTEQDESIKLEIADNGIGIRETELFKADSFGLLGMRERVLIWEGEVRIRGSQDNGTTVTVLIPQEKMRRS